MVPVSQAFQLKVTVVYPTLTDQLVGRIYIPNGDKFIQVVSEFALSVTDKPTGTWSGEVPEVTWCAFIGNAQDKLVYVYVANQPFPMAFDPTNVPPQFEGHYTWNYWTFNCK